MKKQKSITRTIRDEATEILNQIPHNLTKSNYKKIVKRYIEYCRQEFDVKTFEECRGYIQTYSDYLQENGYTASTIHTYIAGVCKCWDVPMKLIEKPIRHISEYTKGRTKQQIKYRSYRDLENEQWARLVEFQALTGIRRSELARLTGKDFVYKDGFYNIFVKNGKGGKDSYVLVTNDAVDTIKKYFEGKEPDEKIFEEEYFKNDLNLHFLRAMNAQRVYKMIENELKRCGPNAREELAQVLRERWYECNLDKLTKRSKPFDEKSIKGKYILRGKNREFAIKNGLPIAYDKLVLKAVSILSISHYRTDISILYMLYI